MKKIPLPVLSLFLCCSAFAQTKNHGAAAIAANHIKERRTYQYPINADGSYDPKHQIYTVTYNGHG